MIDREEIIRRTTSVYLPYKVYHMLESHLVKMCSLDQGEDRLSFTVWATMNLDGDVIGDGRLEKHIVRSRYKLSYEVVQNIITGQMDYK
jgi:exoribonuclease R